MSLIYGKQLPVELLKHVRTPEPSGTHFPIPHQLLLDELVKGLTDAGFVIHENEVVISRKQPKPEEVKFIETALAGGVDPEGVKFAEGVGENAFGGLSITSKDLVGTERQLVCGWRNSHCKMFSSAVCIGSRMMVCSNLCFSSERQIGRKHTRNIERDLPMIISKIVSSLTTEWADMETRIKAYKLVRINREQASDLCMKLVEHGSVPSRSVYRMFDLWLKPEKAADGMIDKDQFVDETDAYDEESYKQAVRDKELELQSAFGCGVSLWGLYNALTETLKGSDFSKHAARTMIAQSLFDKLAGVEIKATTEVEVESSDEDGVHYSTDTETIQVDSDEIDDAVLEHGVPESVVMGGSDEESDEDI